MILNNKKLKKISERILQEAPSTEGGRPLEWRKNLNYLDIPLTKIKIVTRSDMHESEFDWPEEKATKFAYRIKPNLRNRLSIVGLIDYEEMRDSIYLAVPVKGEDQAFTAERSPQPIQVIVHVGEPNEETENRPKGLYWGNVFLVDYQQGNDSLHMYFSIALEQMLYVITAIRSDPYSNIEIHASLLSYTFEVDDALREPYHPRDILIDNSAPCFLTSIEVTTKIGSHFVPKEEENLDFEEPEQIQTLTDEQRAHAELLTVLLSYSKPLNSLVKATWVLVVIIVLYAIFKS